MTQLPTDRTDQSTIAEHVSDHNILAAEHNDLDGHAADSTSVHGIADTSVLATQTDVTNAIAGLVDAAPGTLNTLNELAAALGDDANFAATVTTAMAGKASTAHHAAHEPGGGDVMATDASAATASLRTLGTGAAQAAAGNHAHSGVLVATDFDAVGDLLVGTGADTYARLGKGSALQVLRVNAGATALEYATPAGGGTSPLYDFGLIR